MTGKLTPKRALFVARYLIHGNGTLAAKESGFDVASAHVTASRLLKDLKIKAAIDAGRGPTMEKYKITAERTLQKLAFIAYGDNKDLLDEDGALLPIHLMSEPARAAVGGLDVEVCDGPGRVRTVTHKVKLVDRIRAIELLGKNQNLWGGGDAFSATMQPGSVPGEAPQLTVRFVKAG